MNNFTAKLATIKKITVAGAAIMALSILQIGCEGVLASSGKEGKSEAKAGKQEEGVNTVAPCIGVCR